MTEHKKVDIRKRRNNHCRLNLGEGVVVYGGGSR